MDAAVDFISQERIVGFAYLVVDFDLLIELAPVEPVLHPQEAVEFLDRTASLQQLQRLEIRPEVAVVNFGV